MQISRILAKLLSRVKITRIGLDTTYTHVFPVVSSIKLRLEHWSLTERSADLLHSAFDTIHNLHSSNSVTRPTLLRCTSSVQVNAATSVYFPGC